MSYVSYDRIRDLGILLDAYIDEEYPWTIVLKGEHCTYGILPNRVEDEEYYKELNEMLNKYRQFIDKNVFITKDGELIEHVVGEIS